MTSLHIDLQDGFTNDLVIVQVNGAEVFHKGGVTTKLLLGYADSLTVQVPEGPVNVEVNLPSRNLSKTIPLEVATPVYLGLSILDGRIDYQILHEPFGYL